MPERPYLRVYVGTDENYDDYFYVDLVIGMEEFTLASSKETLSFVVEGDIVGSLAEILKKARQYKRALRLPLRISTEELLDSLDADDLGVNTVSQIRQLIRDSRDEKPTEKEE